MQTLLKDTKAKVWASIVDGRSFLAKSNGSATAERKSWGINAKDSRWKRDGPGREELR